MNALMEIKHYDFPKGSMLFDVRYSYRPECFEIIYLDPITKQLEVVYEDAIIDIWFLKEDKRTNKYQLPQVKMEDCYHVFCKPSQISKVIAENIGGEYLEYYNEYNGRIGNNDMKRHMCECPWVFKADFTPEVYYRLWWLNKYGDDIDVSKITYGLLDIEVDVLDKTIDPKDINDVTQPINAVSIILPHVKIAAMLILSPRPKNRLHSKFHALLEKQQKEFDWLLEHQEEFKRMIIEDDEDNKKYLKDYDIRLHIFDFDHEIDLIKTAFDYINKYRPGMMLSWNASFDDNYLINRASYLGYDPKEFVIPKEFKTTVIRFSEDRSDNFALKTNQDWMYISSYSLFVCQMRLFAKTRKSIQERRSYSLSAVGKDIAKIDKLTQTKSGSFRSFAYTDFIKFLLYNMRDVVVQLAIESKVNDCQSFYAQSFTFATPYAKSFQEMHIVRNTREYFFENDGYVQTNKLIFNNPETETVVEPAFKGAYVAETSKITPTGLVINGKANNNIIYGVLDADASSYYPSNKMGCNMDPMTLLYKCRINNKHFMSGDCVNRSFNQEYIWYDSKTPPRPHDEDMSAPIINSYKYHNTCSVLYNWFNACSISEYFKYIDINL